MNYAAHGQSLEEQSASDSSTVTVRKTQQPTSNELSSLFSILSATGLKSAILSLIEPYSDSFVPKVIGVNFWKDEAVHMDYNDLLSICKDVNIPVSEEQAKAVEFFYNCAPFLKMWHILYFLAFDFKFQEIFVKLF